MSTVDKVKPLQNKKGQKNLGYLTKKQSFYKEKDCFFVGYLKIFRPFLFRDGFSSLNDHYCKEDEAGTSRCINKEIHNLFYNSDSICF